MTKTHHAPHGAGFRHGNRTRVDRTLSGSTVSDVATILPASNRLTEIRDGAGVLSKSFALSTGGDMASQAVAGGPTYDYVYSPRGRLTSLKIGGTEVASYLYDYGGHRVARTITATPQTVHYVYGKDGHVIAEHDGATGALLREYVWLDEMPLALVTGPATAPQYSFIHTGQLDEPLIVTDLGQAKLWDAVSDPWGNALPLSTPTIAQDLRLPGQSLHIESGLFHNWHRDYDPTLGRYIQADPIGLAGGGNLFAYVGGNPLRFVDQDGRAAVLALPALGGAGAGAGGGGIVAACTSNPVGWVVCGTAAIATVGYVGYKVWDNWCAEATPTASAPILTIAPKRKGGGRRSVPIRCTNPTCDAPHGGSTGTTECPECDTKRKNGSPLPGPTPRPLE